MVRGIDDVLNKLIVILFQEVLSQDVSWLRRFSISPLACSLLKCAPAPPPPAPNSWSFFAAPPLLRFPFSGLPFPLIPDFYAWSSDSIALGGARAGSSRTMACIIFCRSLCLFFFPFLALNLVFQPVSVKLLCTFWGQDFSADFVAAQPVPAFFGTLWFP